MENFTHYEEGGEARACEAQLETVFRATRDMTLDAQQLRVMPGHRQIIATTPPAESAYACPDLERATPKERRTVALVLGGLVEVLDDRRSLRQLEQHISVPLYNELSKRMRPPGGTQQGYRLHTLHTQKPRPEVIEANGTAANGQSARAVAARFHRLRYGWQCVMMKMIDDRIPTHW
ncbi:Rv3235 family protein [Amycolatopsis sp. NBC_01480]|uniref:Rv3235 family protein n=1 Tax=Amycolatopsis sp. NBC_01480 TaxID=2903562 RepID=UPI002E2D351E|nr:Rv3235 family protein [Amycolatopsis sp. NBC_01480]